MGAQKYCSSASRVIEHCTTCPRDNAVKITSFPSEEILASAVRVLSMASSVLLTGSRAAAERASVGTGLAMNHTTLHLIVEERAKWSQWQRWWLTLCPLHCPVSAEPFALAVAKM